MSVKYVCGGVLLIMMGFMMGFVVDGVNHEDTPRYMYVDCDYYD